MTTQIEPEPLPCPFCGHAPVTLSETKQNKRWWQFFAEEDWTVTYLLKCLNNNCYAMPQVYSPQPHSTMTNAVLRWNDRP